MAAVPTENRNVLRDPQRMIARARGAVIARALDVLVSALLLAVLLPVLACVAAAIKLDSRGPVFYRCRRVGHLGGDLWMLKFRKMPVDVGGPALTVVDDDRFTRIGRFLATSKLDEIPQLWNVLKGEMALVGPRPEDRRFVDLHWADFARILEVKPGITGLCQLAFAREGEILDPADLLGDYIERLLPEKIKLDRLYASTRSLRKDVQILGWTAVAVLLRRDVAVHRDNGRLSARRRPATVLQGLRVELNRQEVA
jgi:lipopolysaccharide/colanic/teichoic acid biosynthesis glycosyltransferase